MVLSLAHGRSSLRALSGLLLLSVCMAMCITVFDLGRSSHGVMQLVAFPIVLLLMGSVSLADAAIPKWVLTVALLGGLLGALCSYTSVDLASGAFVVARLEDDRSDSDVTIHRDRIRRSLDSRGLILIGSLGKKLQSPGEAQAILSQRSRLSGIVWGSDRWVNVSLRVQGPLSLSAISSDSVLGQMEGAGILKLQLITGVPLIGLSNSRDPATSTFIGKLVPLWRDLPRQLRASNDEEGHYERELRSLAALKASWTSFSHRALPMWMAGTYHLARAVSGSQIQAGELLCAEGSFVAALAQLGPTDTPELQVAIRNNLAVLLLIKAKLKPSERASRKIATRLLREATNKPLAEVELSPGMKVVAHNLEILKGQHADEGQDE